MEKIQLVPEKKKICQGREYRDLRMAPKMICLQILEEASEGGSGLLKQVSNLVSDGLKEEVQLVASRKDESLSGEFRKMADDSAISVDKPRGLVSQRTEALVTKELNGSWLDKIKRITEIEEWR